MNKLTHQQIHHIRSCKIEREALKWQIQNVPSVKELARIYKVNESTIKRTEAGYYHKDIQ